MNLNIDPATVELGLRAVKAVAVADGSVDARERALMAAAARAFGHGTDADPGVSQLEPIAPDELAAALADDTTRARILQAQFVMSIIDGDVGRAEMEVLRTFAGALGVDEPRMKNMQQLMSHHYRLLKLDLNRRSTMVDDAVRHAYRERGLRGAWKTVAPFISKSFALDDELAWRYRRLGLLGEGTFGRAYWVHMRERGFGFPGEPGGFSEEFIKHDCCHVLGGYDTDAEGECQVVAFICGFMKSDPFWYLFMILVHMHLGVETFHNNERATFAFDPGQVLAAFARGAGAVTDLYEPEFDWWEFFPKPLDQARSELGVA